MDIELLDVAGLVAEFPQFFKSEASIYTRRARNPRSMPPPLAIPDSSRLLWNRAAVVAFFTPPEYLAAANVPAAHLLPDQPRRRGRPTKIEQIARREAQRDPNTVDFIEGKADVERGSK